MNKAFSALLPAHHELLQVVAAHVASEQPDYAGEQFVPVTQRDAVFALQGHPRLVAIAQIDRELAMALNRAIEQLLEGDFGDASHTFDELAHRSRTQFLATLSDAEGVTR